MCFFKKKTKVPSAPGWIKDKVDERDYRIEEIFGSLPPVEWKNIVDPVPMFPMKEQDGSSSCVGNAVSKILGVLEYYEIGKYRNLSARYIYSQRENKPGQGMAFRDALDRVVKFGCPTEELMESQGKGENEMNYNGDILEDVKQTALIYKGKTYGYITNNFDSYASLMLQKAPLLIGVAGSNQGWATGVPRPPKPGEAIWYHALMCPPENKNGPNFGIYNGKKAIIGDNSWGDDWGIKGQFILTEDYPILWNFTLAGLPDNWRDLEEGVGEKPVFEFKKPLYYGMKAMPDVVMLQKCLKWLGMFPIEISETGNFYSVTVNAVKLFQSTKQIAVTGTVDAATLEKLNLIFK